MGVSALAVLVSVGALSTSLLGCSFRMPSHVTGTITGLSVHGGGSPGVPVTLTAEAVYGGDFENPSLSVVLSPATPRTIRVQAVADWAQPFMGLGVFVTPATSTRTVAIQATVTLQEPGLYTVVWVPPDGGTIVRTAIDMGAP